jgi:transposase
MPKVSRLEVITTGARRRWTLEEKQRIVAESFALRRNASATARRHGLSNGQMFTWRRLAREGKLVSDDDGVGFVPAIIAPEQAMPNSDSGSPGHRTLENVSPPFGAGARADCMEIVLCAARRRVIVGPDVDVAALKRVIEVLDPR